MSSRDDAWLLDIVLAAKLAIDFVTGIDESEFMADLKTQAAVARQIEIIGEAAKRLSDDFRRDNPELQLREAAGMRDLVIHQYSRVDPKRLWQVVDKDLVELIAKLEPIIPEEPA